MIGHTKGTVVMIGHTIATKSFRRSILKHGLREPGLLEAREAVSPRASEIDPG